MEYLSRKGAAYVEKDVRADREALKELLEATPDIRVRAATSGERALQIAQEWHGADLLITEIFMEPMNGFCPAERSVKVTACAG